MKLDKLGTPLVLLCIAIPFGYAWFLYPNLDDSIPTHFNAAGEADAWGPRSSIFIMPGIMGVVSLFGYALLANIGKVDPKRVSGIGNEIIKKLGIFTAFLLSFFSIIVLYGISHKNTPIDKLIFGSVGLLFSGMGYYMPKLKQNYFAGYKLPWTLENEVNWNRTHKLAGQWWLAGGLIQLGMAIILKGTTLFAVFMSITAIISIVPAVYSYLLFKKGNPES